MITLAHITQTSGRTIAAALLAGGLVAGAATGNPAAASDAFGLFGGSASLFGGQNNNNWNGNSNWSNNANTRGSWNSNAWSLGPTLALGALALSYQNSGDNNRSSAYAQGYRAGQNNAYNSNPYNWRVNVPYGYSADPSQPAQSTGWPNGRRMPAVPFQSSVNVQFEADYDYEDRTNTGTDVTAGRFDPSQAQRPASAQFQIAQFSPPPAGWQIPASEGIWSEDPPQGRHIVEDVTTGAAFQPSYQGWGPRTPTTTQSANGPYMILPRIGSEVQVEDQSDPDRPLITGRVYNAEGNFEPHQPE